MYLNAAGVHRFPGTQGSSPGVAKSLQPPGNSRGREDRGPARDLFQRVEREMIRMGMRHENPVELGKLMQGNPGSTYPWKKSSKGSIEIRISEKPLPGKLN